MYWKRDISWFLPCNAMAADTITWMTDLLSLESSWSLTTADSKERIVGHLLWSSSFICCHLNSKKSLKSLLWRMDPDPLLQRASASFLIIFAAPFVTSSGWDEQRLLTMVLSTLFPPTLVRQMLLWTSEVIRAVFFPLG